MKKEQPKQANEAGRGGKPQGGAGNPNPNTSGLQSGGPGPTAITLGNFPLTWEKFCVNYVIWAKSTVAAELAGFSPAYGHHLLKYPVVQERIKQIRAQDWVVMAALKEACESRALTEQLISDRLVEVLQSGSHERRGYADVVGAARLGLEKLGKITGRGVNVQNNNSAAAAAVAAGEEIPHFFVPPWKKAMNEAKTINAPKLETGEPGAERLLVE